MEIKPWIITAHYNLCSINYGAYSKENPLDNNDIEDEEERMIEDLWDEYNWTILDEYGEDLSDDELEDAYEGFRQDVTFTCDEDTSGEIDYVEIIYDERN